MTLTEFILARIADDEAVARAADGREWWIADQDDAGANIHDAATGKWVALQVRERHATHIVRHDPAHVLAECAALRAVVEWAVTWPLRPSRPSDEDAILRPLAAIWSDHPDYRPEEWA